MRRDRARGRDHAEVFAAEHLVTAAARGLAARCYERERDVAHGVCTRRLPRALQLKGGAAVMDDGGVRRPCEPAEDGVGLVTGAADRVMPVTRGAQLVCREIEVP